MNFQNVQPVRLGQAALTTSYLTVYLTPENTRTFLKDVDICNTTAATISVDMCIVAIGYTAGTANAIFYQTAIPAYSTLQWTGSQILNPKDSLQMKATATGCTVTVTGGEAT